MKYFCVIFWISLMAAMVSCDSEHTESYRESFGVAIESERGLCMKSDDNEIIIPNGNISSTVKLGDRMWMSYTIETSSEQNTFVVTPYRVISISEPELKRSSTTLNDNGIDLWEVWIAQGFLTFDFRILAKDQNEIKNHDYVIMLQSENNDTLSMKIIHDAHGDTKMVLSCRTALAIKLVDLPMWKKKISTLAIEYKDYFDGTIKTIYRKCDN